MAIRLFGQYGYSAVSMRQIASEVGIKGGSIYNHFAGKSDIMDHIITQVRGLMKKYDTSAYNVAQLLETESPRQVLERFITTYDKEDMEILFNLQRIVFTEQYRNPKLSQLFQEEFIDLPIRNITAALELLIELRAIPPCDCSLIANLWARTYLCFGIECTHGTQNLLNNDDYFSTGNLFINLIMYGLGSKLPESALPQ